MDKIYMFFWFILQKIMRKLVFCGKNNTKISFSLYLWLVFDFFSNHNIATERVLKHGYINIFGLNRNFF